MNKIILIACVKAKLPRPAPAARLYTSPWFKKARAYAEAHADRWYILSAKHGLITPAAVIAPYDQTLARRPVAVREAWAADVLYALKQVADPSYDRLIFLAGRAYRDPLVDWCEADGFITLSPLAGLGIGQQLAWFDEQLKMINQ